MTSYFTEDMIRDALDRMVAGPPVVEEPKEPQRPKRPKNLSAAKTKRSTRGMQWINRADRIDPAVIVKAVAAAHNLDPETLRTTPFRVYYLAKARHHLAWVLTKYTAMSFSRIAYFMNRKDHSTIIHAAFTVETNLKEYEKEIKIAHRLMGATDDCGSLDTCGYVSSSDINPDSK